MWYVNLYETVDDFAPAYYGDDYTEPWLSYVVENNGVKYNKTERDILTETPLTFEVAGDGVIAWKAVSTSHTVTLEYKKNNDEWEEITSTTAGTLINVVSGDVVSFRGDNLSMGYDSDNFSTFSGTTCQFNLYGNIMSLLNSTGFLSTTALSVDNQFAFFHLFETVSGLISAEKLILPATRLAHSCYCLMFSGCTSLTMAPVLPATTLAVYCYSGMFQGCTSLAKAPELPVATLSDYCYRGMFQGCTSLTTAPELPTTALARACYQYMFAGCTGLTTAPAILPATTLSTQCYTSMFAGCTSLTMAPILPAKSLVSQCYYFMFNRCTNLSYVKCLATDVAATYCTVRWLENVAPNGTFVKDANMSNWSPGNDGIPNGWTVQNAE